MKKKKRIKARKSTKQTKNAKIKRLALVSAWDKTGLVSFVKGIQALGFDIVSTGGKVNVGDLQSQTWYAFSEAVVLPVPKESKVEPGPVPSKEKKVSPMKVAKGHRVSFSAKSTSHYAWSPWKYIFIGFQKVHPSDKFVHCFYAEPSQRLA